jgi:hypothetical protein
LSLIAAEPTALGVDLISGGKRELLPGGVVGPVASEVSSMVTVRNLKVTGKQKVQQMQENADKSSLLC